MNHSTVRAKASNLIGCGILTACFILGAQAQTPPKYKFDPDWPKPLPNKWKLGGVTGLAVDKDDNVWVLDRPADLRDTELHAAKIRPLRNAARALHP